MTRQDLEAVTEIDREAFPTQWPPADYGYEFKNQMSHYVVACDSGTIVPPQPAKARESKLWAWLGGVFRRNSSAPEPPPSPCHYIVGFAGFWVMAGEAHITSIAVREECRRKGIGELLLAGVLDLALDLNADVVTLEVRVSNTGAQSLYRKYGFDHVGERRRYYLDRGPTGDTREDALIMTTESLKSEGYRRRLEQLREARASR